MEAIGKSLERLYSQGQVGIDNSDEWFKNKFPGITPNDIEINRGKLFTYQLAAERQLTEQREARARQRREMLITPWTYEQMKSKAIEAGKLIGVEKGFDFVIDDENSYAFHLLCLFFTNDPAFEEEGIETSKGLVPFSLKKGIWLQSSTRGTGKSVLLQCFRQNKRSCFAYKHTRDLAQLYQSGGYSAIEAYTGPIRQPATVYNFYQEWMGLMFDDLFTEPIVNYMGSPCNISQHLISTLYDVRNVDKSMFHCTSNCDGQEIEKVAGTNYRSRMSDMFNLIKLEGQDRRLKTR